MKPVIMDMKDMSESSEVYAKRPKPLLVGFIYCVAAMLVVSLLWMRFAQIDIVIYGSGMLKNVGGIYQISSLASGTVTKCNVSDGQYVNANDVIYIIDSTATEEKIQYYTLELGRINERLLILEAYHQYLGGDAKALDVVKDNSFYQEILDKKNLLDANVKAGGSDANVKEIYMLTEKISVANEILTYNSRKKECDMYLKDLQLQMENCTIRAVEDGYFYSETGIGIGSYIYEGNTIGRIYPEADTYYAQIYIENANISQVYEGQPVNLQVASYSSDGYELSGTITGISKDAVTDSAGGSYYVINVSCQTSSEKPLVNGMACQAGIVVRQENVLEYLLKKIDLMH